MIKIKRIFCVLLAICTIFGVAAMAIACDGDKTPCETHNDENKDGKCDVCGAEVEAAPSKCDECVDGNGDGACDNCGACIECIDVDGDNVCEYCGKLVKQPIEVTFAVKSEDGSAIAVALPNTEIRIIVKQGKTEMLNDVLGTEGTAKVTLIPGSYSLEILGLPDGWYCEGAGKSISVSESNKSFELHAINNNPDGSEKKPFYIGTNKVSVEFKSGETLNYETKGAKKYLIITNKNAKVTYNGFDFLPDENGRIRLAIEPVLDKDGQLNTNTYTPFTITNTSASANEIVAEFEIQPGSSEDPFDIALDTPTQTTVANDNTVFYQWKSPLKGYLVLDCTSADSYIMMHNVTSCEVTQFTDGKGKLYIRVSKDDIVMIAVSTTLKTETELDFSVKAYGGVEQMPLEVSGSAAFRLNMNKTAADKNSVVIKYTGEAKSLTVVADGVSITVNGNAIEGVKTNDGTAYTFNAATNDIIVITAETTVTEENNSIGVVIN